MSTLKAAGKISLCTAGEEAAGRVWSPEKGLGKLSAAQAVGVKGWEDLLGSQNSVDLPGNCLFPTMYNWASLVAQIVKNLPAMQETQVGSLGWEDPPGEGNGYPLQNSCLENPTDRGALWAPSWAGPGG